VCELDGCHRSLAGVRPDARYCSEAHRLAAWRRRKPVSSPVTASLKTEFIDSRFETPPVSSPVTNHRSPPVETPDVEPKNITKEEGVENYPASDLVLRLARAVAHERWCGGIRRDHLAELLKLDPRGRRFNGALWTAYRRGLVDFAGGGWVVPGQANDERRSDDRKPEDLAGGLFSRMPKTGAACADLDLGSVPWQQEAPQSTAGLSISTEPSRAQSRGLPSKMRSTSWAAFLLLALAEYTAGTTSTAMKTRTIRPAPSSAQPRALPAGRIIAVAAMTVATRDFIPASLGDGWNPRSSLRFPTPLGTGMRCQADSAGAVPFGSGHAALTGQAAANGSACKTARDGGHHARSRAVPRARATPWAYERPELEQLGPDLGRNSPARI
jgi:hypothetical protein